MTKHLLIYQAPVFTRSGYGNHARDILRSLRDMSKYDIKIIPTRWGNTPQNQVDESSEFGRWMLSNLVIQPTRKPDIFIQMSVANEFEAKGNFNIGITAGVETTVLPKEFIDGCNRMDLNIVPSRFTKNLLLGTIYHERNNQTGQLINEFKITKPVEVLPEGVDLGIYLSKETTPTLDVLANIETDFNFLFVGHWLRGDIGQDRKDVGMLIKTFCSVFKYLPREKQPGLVLKTSHAGFSILDRESIADKISAIVSEFGDKAPPIYLLHGDLTDSEMARLYNHDKIKAMVSFTKGEGYGRPLAEFAVTGKPVIVSKWSGHTDFLPEQNTVFLDGSLTKVHSSVVDKFLLADSSWFTVNYSDAANKLYKVYSDYATFLEKSRGLADYIVKNFSFDVMHSMFLKLMEKYLSKQPHMVELTLPKLNTEKMSLPNLNKING